MKQEIIKSAQNIIQQRKLKAIHEYETKLSPYLSKAEFAEMHKDYVQIMIENAKKESEGQKVDRTVELRLKKNFETMTKCSQPNFSCKLCNDEGYKNGEMCICLKKEISKQILKESGFEKLESFESSIKTSGTFATVYQKMQEWCNTKSAKNLIYIAGPTGVGKTYLIRSMANELIENGKVVKIVTAFNLNQDFKDFSKKQDDELLNKYLNCEILFIDDLGTEPIYKNITIEYLYLVINERKMRKLPTIITSNLDMEDIRNRYDERIFSRIADRQTSINIFLDGTDKRLKK